MFSITFSRSIRTVRPRPKASSTLFLRGSRNVSTLPENPHINGRTCLLTCGHDVPAQAREYVFEHPLDASKCLLSLLPTSPPTPSLAIGTSSALPPTPANFTENPQFLGILQSVFHAYATNDPEVKRQAAVFSSPSGFNLGGNNRDSAGAANHQGGMGGANRGGWLHVSDTRNPPDWGRIAWPEDIFGSVEVNGDGKFVDERGNYQTSGTYRIITREGILGLTPFLREKLVQRLRELEGEVKQ